MSPEIHHAAATGFARAADAYERGRADFPAEAVAFLVEALDLRSGGTLLELGAGTGKLTRLLTPTRARIVALEPVAEMRAIARSLAAGALGLGATAEHPPLATSSIDAAVAAQAFHWFDGPRVLEALDVVLRPGAPLALLWNVRDEDEPWVAALTALIEPYRGDTPSHRSMRWLEAFADAPAWAAPARTSFPYLHRTTREATVDRVLSISFIAALSEDDRRRVAKGVRALLPAGEDVVFPYHCDVWLTQRLPVARDQASATIA